MQKAAGHYIAACQLTDIAKLLLVSQDYHSKEVLEPLTICDINASQFISFYLFFIQNCVINLFFLAILTKISHFVAMTTNKPLKGL